MIVAFTFSANRMAPVFDTARQVSLLTIESGKVTREVDTPLPEAVLNQKALHLSERGVEALVCGAISRQLQELVGGYGIQVIPFITGEREEIIQAYIMGSITSSQYKMPGCCGQRRAGGRAINRGQGRGMMRGGRGRWSNIGQTSRCEESCICPNCGAKQPHQRGVPCMDVICPSCGSPMVRKV